MQKEVNKPIVAFAYDNSSSLLLTNDSSWYHKNIKRKFGELKKNIPNNWDFEDFTFGKNVKDKVNWQFNEKYTDISNLFEEIKMRYSNRNLSAVVLASDGIYNRGKDPVYSAKEMNIPVYPVALGDTSIRKDIVLKRVRHNRLAYLGNKFQIEIIVNAKRFKGKETTLKVKENGEILHKKKIEIEKDNFIQNIPFKLSADSVGLQKYKVELNSIKGEVSKKNNSKTFFIDILDSKKKILILANTPHPDIRAIKEAIESNENYRVRVKLINEFKGDIGEQNLIILHQLPSKKNGGKGMIRSAINKKTPLLFIVGSQTKIKDFNQLKPGIRIKNNNNRMDEVRGKINKKFTLFNLNKKLEKIIQELPPINVPFGEFKTNDKTDILFHQKVGMVNTKDPLILFQKSPTPKRGVILGEGIWRWRLHAYRKTNKHNTFNSLISQTVQMLAVKEDKSHFRVHGKNDYKENETIILEAELYNESYELINKPDVQIKITNEKGKEYPFTFTKSGKKYRLDAGRLPVGEYHYKAKTELNEKNFEEKGGFSISPVKIEMANTVANHQTLYKMSNETNGKLIYPEQIDRLKNSNLFHTQGNNFQS
ncbi:MAG: hypothetical protein ABEH43_09905 [Flavobacteriales bacterium]